MSSQKVNPSYADRISYQTDGDNKHNNIELDQMDYGDMENGKNPDNLNGV